MLGVAGLANGPLEREAPAPWHANQEHPQEDFEQDENDRDRPTEVALGLEGGEHRHHALTHGKLVAFDDRVLSKVRIDARQLGKEEHGRVHDEEGRRQHRDRVEHRRVAPARADDDACAVLPMGCAVGGDDGQDDRRSLLANLGDAERALRRVGPRVAELVRAVREEERRVGDHIGRRVGGRDVRVALDGQRDGVGLGTLGRHAVERRTVRRGRRADDGERGIGIRAADLVARVGAPCSPVDTRTTRAQVSCTSPFPKTNGWSPLRYVQRATGRQWLESGI